MTRSQRCVQLDKDFCELCGKKGSSKNPLTAHHCDGNAKNNVATNFLVVHRWRCHTWADAVTQCYMAQGRRCTWAAIKKAYQKLYHQL